MKKSLLAAALIVGFAGAAQAQSTSVTLYGVVDGGIGYTQFKDGNGNKGTSTGFLDGGQSSNRWGLRGSEDLGGGLSAIFTLESGFSLGSGQQSQGGRLFGREAFVGLKSSEWGQLTFGRQGSIGHQWLSGIVSPFGNNFGQARASGAFSAAEARYDNQIQYQTPSFSGFQFGVGYSFNTSGNQQFKQAGQGEPNTRAWTTGLRYVSGPVAAILAYDQVKDRSNLGGTGLTVKSWSLAGSYNFDVATLHLGVGRIENGWLDTNSFLNGSGKGGPAPIARWNDQFRAYTYTVGLSAPLGERNKIMGSWSMVDPSKKGLAYAGAATKLKSQHIFGLGFTHDLSKRTNLYVMGSYVDDLALQPGAKSYTVGAGVRHRF